MPSPAETIELLAEEPSGDRTAVRALLRDSEAHRSWVSAREAKWLRYLKSLPADPSSPAKDTAGEVEREQKIGAGQARSRTERAEQLAELPETEKALERGTVTEGHVDVLTRARAKADAKAQAALLAHENRLLDEARTMTPQQFADHVAKFVQKHSADDGRSEWERKKARRRFWIRRNRQDGMYDLGGKVDPELGVRIKRTVDREAERLWRRDHQGHPADEAVPVQERDNEQRYADALGEVCRKADAHPDTPAQTVDRALVLLHHDTLLDDLEAHGISPRLADGTPLPASVARRMACDASLTPVVLNGDSVPLDLGRSQRVAQPAQRAGLGLQWGTCCVADCDTPFDWCEIHHIDEWSSNGHGKTDLANLVPACRHNCHDLLHAPGWSIAKLADGSVTTTAPDGRTWHRQPNGPGVKRPAEPPPAAATQPDPTNGDPAATLFDNAA